MGPRSCSIVRPRSWMVSGPWLGCHSSSVQMRSGIAGLDPAQPACRAIGPGQPDPREKLVRARRQERDEPVQHDPPVRARPLAPRSIELGGQATTADRPWGGGHRLTSVWHRAGGEGGIRTRDGLPHTAFPVRRPRPLGDLSAGQDTGVPGARRGSGSGSRAGAAGRIGGRSRAGRGTTRRGVRRVALPVGWRRGWDSNPRCFRTPLFESGTINHSDTSPPERIAKGSGAGPRAAMPGAPASGLR